MDKTQEKHILITGGAGFLGSHLCETLLGRGHFVICLDNFSTGSETNLKSFQNHPRFTFVNHDVCFPFPLQEKIDEIFNLACPASPIHYQLDPVRTTLTSFQGAMNMLEIARRTGSTILQASTSEVYGDPHMHPQSEIYWGNVNPIGKRACYDEGKRCAETLFFDFHRQHHVKIKIARIFNTYGPRMQLNDGRVVSNFIVQALINQPMTLYGDGSQTRSFCYVTDMIEGFSRLMNSADSCTGPINLGNPTECTVLELAELIKSLTGSRSQFSFRPLPSDDPKKRKPEIQLAKTVLNWAPEVGLEAGLKETITYFDKILSSNKLANHEN